MRGKRDRIRPVNELDDEDRIHIIEVFHEDVVPRLMKMDARIGNISCEFAGEKYRNWVIEFRSNRSGLEIVGFEYDEGARGINLAASRKVGI